MHMGFDGLKKKLEAQAAANQQQQDKITRDREAFAAALPGLTETAIKPAFEALKAATAVTNGSFVEYGAAIAAAGRRGNPQPYQDVKTAIASFDWRHSAKLPDGRGAMVGSSPIHIIVDRGGLSFVIIAWSNQAISGGIGGYAECDRLTLSEVTQARIENTLERIVENMLAMQPPNAGLLR